MISVEAALERVLDAVHVLESRRQPLLESLGQVLSEDIRAGFDVPPLDNSAMDGYAVRYADVSAASPENPVTLTVIETVAAGAVSKQTVTAGTAARIMTGAPLPAGADTVVPFEETDETTRGQAGDRIGIHRAGRDANVRRAGEDIARGQLVLAAGTRLGPAQVGVLASLGHAEVSVIRRPVVAVLATGDELAELGTPLPPGHIYNSNSYGLAALVRRYGGVPRVLGIARDNAASLREKLDAARNADMIITSGGVSMGDYDIVKDILAEAGEIDFWQVRMKPGKPLAFGQIGGVPHLGLPGNPVSSMVSFEIFARPALYKMMGRTDLTAPTVRAVLADAVNNRDGRRVFTRVVLSGSGEGYRASLTGPQGSGVLTSMIRGDGLAVIPEDRARVEAGETVEVILLEREILPNTEANR